MAHLTQGKNMTQKKNQSTAQLALQFRDVKEILDQALKSSGGSFRCASHGKAVRFRQRCYIFMKNWREATSPNPSNYDVFTFPALAPGEVEVSINLRTTEGVFTPAGGPAIDTPEKEEDDALLDIAKSIGGDLGLE